VIGSSLVPKPRVHLTRYHGVFAPHSRWRSRIPAERHRTMTWAQRRKRVFRLDLETCAGYGGQVRVVSCIEDPAVNGGRPGPSVGSGVPAGPDGPWGGLPAPAFNGLSSLLGCN
jgi:hypothetical protein